MKAALNDESLPVQRGAAAVLIAMFSSSDATQLSSSDLEAIILQCTKSLDSVDQVTRHGHAQLVGHLLASTQIERVVPPPETGLRTTC
jgi:hypothetical protein